MSDYGIVNFDGKGRFEVLDSDSGRRVAVFDDLSDAQLFIKIKEGKLTDLIKACRDLLDYRRRAGPLYYQLEKADDFHRLIGMALEEWKETEQ